MWSLGMNSYMEQAKGDEYCVVAINAGIVKCAVTVNTGEENTYENLHIITTLVTKSLLLVPSGDG